MDNQKRDTILIVDDMVSSRIYLRNIFQDEYELMEASNGEIALRLLRKHRRRIAAVLLDVVMPGKDGYRTLEEMEKEGFLQEIPVLIVTANATTGSEARALELGACDLIKKPFDPYVIKRRVSIIVELFQSRRKLENKVEDLSRAVSTTNASVINTLAAVTEFRSLESGQHVVRIQEFTRILLESVAQNFPEYDLDEREIELICNAAVLHDVGKVAIPDAILNKPGRLTAEEFEIMKTHTTGGCQILEKMNSAMDEEYMRYAYNICRYHHERWDGGGYPDGLKRDNIPFCAQVVALADVYDALTTPRVYKGPYSHERSVEMILNGECGEFNPELLACFRQVREQFADCARAYADEVVSARQPVVSVPAAPAPAGAMALDAEQLAAAKYHTILQSIDGAAIEVDMDEGTFRLVYDTSDAFEALREGGDIRQALQKLLQAVHPEDKPTASAHMVSFQKEFFEDGLRRQSQCYRVRSSPWSEYFWVEAVSLRINTRNPKERKAICLWRRLAAPPQPAAGEGQPPVPAGEQRLDGHFWSKFPWMLLRCRVDRGMTIERGTERLAKLLGYARQELEEQFGNRLLDLIMPEDREIVQTHLKEARARGDSVCVEYRLRHKDGSAIWVQDCNRMAMEADGLEHVYRVVLDVTQSKEERERLYLSLEGYQQLMSQSDEIYFEWDMDKDEIFLTENFHRIFGHDPKDGATIYSTDDVMEGIHPEDMAAFQAMLEESREGRRVSSRELRIRKADQNYLWCRMRVACRWQQEGGTPSLVGTIANIHEEKLALQAMRMQIEYDSLTKLLNRAAATSQIEQYLQTQGSGDSAALLVLDIDNFKTVNDRYGHMSGDMVLVACAQAIRSLFRSSDVVARLGGDEFLVLLKDIPGREIARRSCQKLLKKFSEEVSRQVPDGGLSCSIGVAMVPRDGDTFPTLFQHADQALLCAKEGGKNRFAFYGDLEGREVSYTSSRTEIDSDGYPRGTSVSFMDYALRHLYRHGSVEKTVQAMLALVGEQMNVSRVYIFENSRDNRYCSNTFEWCNQGIAPMKDALQKLSYETTLKGLRESFDQSGGIYFCRDISELPEGQRGLMEFQGVKSLLQCAIWDNGAFRGYVGFDECVVDRLWTQEQIDALHDLSQLISLILLRKRSGDDMKQWSESLLHILNRSKDWIYVVDEETLEVLFLNEKIQSLAQLRLGDRCYHTIMGREEQCGGCPVKGLTGSEIRRVEATNDLLKRRVKAQASRLVWEGRDAVLIICEEQP